MGALTESLGTVRERIEQYARQGIGEQNTKAALIVPVLRALGWDLEDLEEVRLEYRRRPADNPVDYALLINRIPRLFVEAKALGDTLDDRKWSGQIITYATMAGVRWVVLTNGDEYRIYNSHAAVPVEDKLFRRVAVSDEGSRPEATIALLSKESISEMEELWREDFVDRQVREAISSAFSPDPDPALVRLIRRRMPDLSPSQVKRALARLTLRLEAGEPIATVGPIGSPPAPRTRSAKKAVPRKEAGDQGTPWSGVGMSDILAAGIVKPPLELERPYKGTVLRARLESDGRVTFQNQTYGSLSTAGGIARATVIGARPGRKFPQTSGWTFWHYRDSNGEVKQLDTLRQRYFATTPKPSR